MIRGPRQQGAMTRFTIAFSWVVFFINPILDLVLEGLEPHLPKGWDTDLI